MFQGIFDVINMLIATMNIFIVLRKFRMRRHGHLSKLERYMLFEEENLKPRKFV